MLPRERVLLAIEHKATDRAPADYAAHQEVTDGLIARLGVADVEELRQALGVDMRAVGCNYTQPDSAPDEKGHVVDMWGTARPAPVALWECHQPIYAFTQDTTLEEVHAHPWPDPAAIDCSAFAAECARYHDTYAVYGGPWCPFFHEVGWMIGQENLFMWMLIKPDVVQAIINHVVDYEIAVWRRALEAAHGMLDIMYVGNDFGTQRGLVMSPGLYERFYRQPLKRFFDIGHEYGCKVMQHSCGAIRDIIPMLIKDGVDILDPLQVAATGMGFAGLVRDFGRRLTLHGGVDTQTLLPFGTAEEVREQLRSYRTLTQSGGFILSGSQSYIEDIPLDNILAIYDENMRLTQSA